MKNEYEKSKRRKTWTLFDLFLILLLLFSLAGLGLRWWNRRQITDTALVPIELTLRMSAVPVEVAEQLASGDVLYAADGEEVGLLREIRREPSAIYEKKTEGYRRLELPADMAVDLVIRVALLGRPENGIFLLRGRVPLPIGAGVQLYTNTVELNATVVQGA